MPEDSRFVWTMLAAAAAGTATTVAFVLLHEDLGVVVPSEAIGVLVLMVVHIRRRRCSS